MAAAAPAAIPRPPSQLVHPLPPAPRSKYPDLIVVDYTLPSVLNENAEFYCANQLPFVMGTTGGDRERLLADVAASGCYAVIAPNMGKQIVAFQVGRQPGRGGARGAAGAGRGGGGGGWPTGGDAAKQVTTRGVLWSGEPLVAAAGVPPTSASAHTLCHPPARLQTMMEMMADRFPGCFSGYSLAVAESHQRTKVDTSGTAKAVVKSFNKMGLPLEEVGRACVCVCVAVVARGWAWGV